MIANLHLELWSFKVLKLDACGPNFVDQVKLVWYEIESQLIDSLLIKSLVVWFHAVTMQL